MTEQPEREGYVQTMGTGPLPEWVLGVQGLVAAINDLTDRVQELEEVIEDAKRKGDE